MSVVAKFRLTDAVRTNLTMELTMTLGEWTALREALEKFDCAASNPFWTLRHRVRELEELATKHFLPPADPPETSVLESAVTPELLAKYPEFTDPEAILAAWKLMKPKKREKVMEFMAEFIKVSGTPSREEK